MPRSGKSRASKSARHSRDLPTSQSHSTKAARRPFFLPATTPSRYAITSTPHAQHPVARAFHPQPPRDRQAHRRQDAVFQTRPLRPGMQIPQEPLHQPRLTSVWPGHRRPRPSPNPEPAIATQRIGRHRPSAKRPLHLRRQYPPKLVRNPLWSTARTPRPTSHSRRPQPTELAGRRSGHPRLGPDRTTNRSVPHDQGQPEARAHPRNGGRKR